MSESNWKYCNDYVNYSRFKTREVNVGDVALGAVALATFLGMSQKK